MNASPFSLFQNIPEPFRRRLATLRTRLSMLLEPMGRPCAPDRAWVSPSWLVSKYLSSVPQPPLLSRPGRRIQILSERP